MRNRFTHPPDVFLNGRTWGEIGGSNVRRYKIEMDNGIYTLDADDFSTNGVLHLTRRNADGSGRETVAIFPMSRLVALTDVTDETLGEEIEE